MSSPILRQTRTIACIGRNFAAHAAELQNQVPREPFFFLKPASSLVRLPGEPAQVRIPPGVGKVHHEAELAVVIGKKASMVRAENAMDFVMGYAVALDVTGRDLQDKSKKMGLPWTRAKGYDTWCPVGPVVDKALVEDLEKLVVCLSLNGEEKQRAGLDLMIFKIPQLIEAVTDCMTLEPGDLILTGTPSGVGPMEPGDKVKCWIEGLPSPALEVDVVERPPSHN